MNPLSAKLSRGGSKARLWMFGGLLAIWVFGISARLVYLQVFQRGAYVQRANRQQQRNIEVSAQRGIIYDRNGQELAMSVLVDSVYAVPSEVPDQATTASILARVLNADAAEILARMKSQKNFAWVARKIDAETADRIRDLNLRGIGFQKESKRFYPKRELAAQAIGYVGLDDEGLAGVEIAFNDELRGNPGTLKITQDARRQWFGSIERQSDPGANLVLTIDEKIQYIAEKEIDQAIIDTGAKAATIVVQNPRTGEILALANRPTFNPNLSKKITPAALKNHAVSDVYEPGSVFKTVTYSSTLEEHLTRLDEVVNCDPGFIVVGGIRIRDAHHIGTVTVEHAYAESSDVAAVKMGLRLGPERLLKHIRDFGFGQQTGIELPGETRGLVKPLKNWSGSSIGAMSIGQEIGVTPLQIISMVSTIANDGGYTPPRIVAGITSPTQGFQQVVFRPRDQRRVISPLTAAQMRRMMQDVVFFGTARRAQLNGYTSAGKTGTAQKIDPKTHRYSATDYVGSFVGFAPVNNPAISIAVILDSARGLHQGGQVSAPVFKRVAEQVLAYLNVPHDAEIKHDPHQLLLARQADANDAVVNRVGGLAGAELDDANSETVHDENPQMTTGKEKLLNARLALPSTATMQGRSSPAGPDEARGLLAGVEELPAPPTNEPAHPPGSVVVQVEGGPMVPNFAGKSMRGAIELAQQSGIALNALGSGIAREQSPPAGTQVAPHATVIVRFAR